MADERKHDLSRLTPELRTALVAELTSLIDCAAALTPDEIVVLLHLLGYAGFSGEGCWSCPSCPRFGEGASSCIPAAHLPPDRVRAAVKILRRRGVLKDAEHGAAVVDNLVLRALADTPRA